MRAWVANMAKADVGAATIESAIGLLRQILDIAVEDRRVAINPVAGIKAPRRKHSVRGYLTYAQVEALASQIGVKPIANKGGGVRLEPRPTGATIVRFLAYTGLRFGEMAALHVGAIDFDRRLIFVHEAVSEVGGKIVWGSTKTHERRNVPFPEWLLADQLRDQIGGRGSTELVFPGERGAVRSVNSWRRRDFLPAVARCQQADSTVPECDAPRPPAHGSQLGHQQRSERQGGPTDGGPPFGRHDVGHLRGSLPGRSD